MIACFDVHYHDKGATAACVCFDDWAAAAAASEHVVQIAQVEPYVPGQFYRRELPCILRVMEVISEPIDLTIIDGYVWLGDNSKSGLGAHLFEALDQQVPVVGVAKTSFKDTHAAIPVVRGKSTSPLYVTSAGIPAADAADQVRRMHGKHRVPALLKVVDRLCRGRGRG